MGAAPKCRDRGANTGTCCATPRSQPTYPQDRFGWTLRGMNLSVGAHVYACVLGRQVGRGGVCVRGTLRKTQGANQIPRNNPTHGGRMGTTKFRGTTPGRAPRGKKRISAKQPIWSARRADRIFSRNNPMQRPWGPRKEKFAGQLQAVLCRRANLRRTRFFAELPHAVGTQPLFFICPHTSA